MLYNVVLYLITFKGQVYQIQDYETFSPEPIIECTVKEERAELPWDDMIYKVCKTERLYYFMTGIDAVEIQTTGLFDA